MRRFFTIGLSVAVLAFLATWWFFSEPAHSRPTGDAAPPNEAAPSKNDLSNVKSKDTMRNPGIANASQALFDPLEVAPCNLTPIFEQDVSSQVDGIFDAVHVDVGRQVLKGDLLGQLDDRQLSAQVELLAIRANSRVAEHIAKAQFDEADAKVEYAKKANESGLRTVPELETKTYLYQRERYANEMKKAREERDAAEKELDRTRLVLQQHAIRAGLTGEIVKVYKRTGEAVKQAEALFRVANCNSLRVEGLCKIQQASLIRVGMHALVEPDVRGEQMTKMIGHTGPITALAISPDGRLLASASEDRIVFLWNWPQGTRNMALAHSADVTAVAFAPNPGNAYTLLTGSGNGQGQLWTVPAAGNARPQPLSQQHEGPIRAVAFNADGTYCATAGNDKRIGIWDVATGKLCYWLHAGNALSAHQGSVTSLRFCPDGSLVSAGRDNVVKVWSLTANAGTLVRVHSGRTAEVAQLGVSADGQRILFDLGEEMRVLDRDTGTCLGSFHSRRQGRFQGLAEFSPSGKLVLTSSSNQRLQLWRVPPTVEETHFFRHGYTKGFHRASLLALGSYTLASAFASSEVKAPQLWDLAGGEIRHFVIPSASIMHAGVFAPDESVFFTGGSDKIVRAWAVPSALHWQLPYEARITYIGSQIERGTDMVRIRAELDNPEDADRRLRAGMFATLRIFPETVNLN
jgi:WD40 repeat protein/biotin carboxyl carrier protein